MVQFKKLSSNVKVDQRSNKFFNHENQTVKHQCYKVDGSGKINNLEFYCYEKKGKSIVIVRDNDCLKERTYVVGSVRELDDFEQVEIVSQEQVINAWATGKVWF